MTTTQQGMGVSDAVARVLAEQVRRPGLRVALTPLSAGASRQTSLVRATAEDWARSFVLQRERAPAGVGTARVEDQVRLLETAAGAGVPVPRVVAWSATADPLGAPYVLTEFVAGHTLPQRILRDPELAGARADFATQCGAILARLHATAPTELSFMDEPDQLATTVAHIDETGEPHPAFELAIAWLRANRPEPVPPRLVHGDFRNGNLIVGEQGVRAVLDWELSHLGDPAEDLAWLCLKAWRFRGEGEVGGMGEVRDLLDAYERHGGVRVDPERLFWWQVLGTLRWGAICQLQARIHLDGHSRSVELAAIGRRVCETEYDLLRMLP